MNDEPIRRLLQSLRQWGKQSESALLSDGELLERFRTWRDQAAFELLLWRHGPMVLGVCRRLLSDRQDAEDAFQAVWLTFVRKAPGIRQGQTLGAWLHRVACRVALRARAGRAHRSRHEQGGLDLAVARDDNPGEPDVRAVVDEEVNRLPSRQRLAFVLCCLEGKTGEEAARQLGCKTGTVSSRLTRARERLRIRLTRRGLAPAVGLVLAASTEALAAPVPKFLIPTTLEACRLFSAGKRTGPMLSAQAVTWAEGVLRAMLLSKLKLAAVLLLAASLLLVGRVFIHEGAEAAPVEAEARAEASAAPKKPPQKKAVLVRVVRPEKGGVDFTTTQACNVEAFEALDLYPAVSGVLKNVSVDVGSRVRKGELLAEVDAPQLAIEEKQAFSAIKQAHGQLQLAKAGVEGAEARVSVAKAIVQQREVEQELAQATVTSRQRALEALKRIRDRPGVSPIAVVEKEEQLQTAKGELLAARAAVVRAKAEVDVRKGELAQAEAAIESAEGGLDAARAGLARVRLTRDSTRISAPFDGAVTELKYRAGAQVLAVERSSRPLLRIVRTDRIRAITTVPENFVTVTQVGLPVELQIGALNESFKAAISRTSFAIDEKTRTMRVEIDVPNPQEKLRPGMFGSAMILLAKGKAEALRIPSSCLVGNAIEARGNVWVVRDGKAHRLAVRMGQGNGEMVEILSGLGPEDQVIMEANAPFEEGTAIEITKMPIVIQK